jgi:hypothetical protein
MSQVIYARVEESLKEAVEAYRSDRGFTLTAAAVDLLERGLAAASDEASVRELTESLATASAERDAAVSELRSANGELGALRALAARAGHQLGTCPKTECSSPITGYDLLATGRCPVCDTALPDVLRPETSESAQIDRDLTIRGGVDDRELLLLLGAIGAVVGVAYLASRSA